MDVFSRFSQDPHTLLHTLEAFIGFFIEAIIVAVITQRILGNDKCDNTHELIFFEEVHFNHKHSFALMYSCRTKKYGGLILGIIIPTAEYT
jgi:hypothetical protein